MLPTMNEHGCPPEHHRTTVDPGGVVQEESCIRCGYTITYGPALAHPGDTPDRRRHGPDRKG
ncbi:hypothetical protein GCM10010357_52250 [Streptomyces luteireticuli]|uniref:Uncharacterized protein n=1 Tax=Streptomyces luteireticuli TaxID=173858 RepID=A0ABP3IT84_9ACTN